MTNTQNTSKITSHVVDCLQAIQTIPHTPLHEPFFGGNEWGYLKECLDSGFVSSIGAFVDRFEKDLVAFTGAKHAIAVVNGTAALHISLLLSGVKQGDEVIIPALTFVATANSVAYCNATPHFADISKKTLCLDAEKLRQHLAKIAKPSTDGSYLNKQTGQRLKAMVVMHTFGQPADMDSLKSVCEDFKLELIEDAAESLGSWYKDQHTGTIGKMGALSFNGNKIITSGGGGAILTNDSALAQKAKHITTTAKKPHPWNFFHDQIGFNYRMPNINAALGVAQLQQLPEFLKIKRKLAEKYSALFRNVPGVTFFMELPFAKSNYWLNILLLAPDQKKYRDEVLTVCNQLGFGLRPAWELMHKLPMFKTCPKMDLRNAEDIASRLINLPSSVTLNHNLDNIV